MMCSRIATVGYAEKTDETINHIEIKHNWVGKVIHMELCNRLNFDHTTKVYMHKLESVSENEMHKIL